jgi:DNA-binding beta-propeller fold protein YncE
MPLIVAAPPEPVPAFGGFDYVTIDESRHRAFAAHTRSSRLLIVDTTSGRIAGQVDVGPMHGVAFDPETGIVFTGNGTDDSLSKVDPERLKVLASVNVPGHIDAIAYDAGRGRIYADQDGAGNVYVVDAATMKLIGTIPMPSDDLESPTIDPKTGVFYQNLANGGGFAVVDPAAMKVVKVVKTPQLQNNHALVFAPGANQLIVSGTNGILSAYAPDGTLAGSADVQPRIDQCSTGSKGLNVACAGRGIVTIATVKSGEAPRVVARLDTGHAGIHTIGIDETTSDVWVVWSDSGGDWVQRLRLRP